MTGVTTRIGGVLGHAVAIGLRARLGHRRQIRVHAGRRFGHMLAEELLTHEQAARGRRRVFGLRRDGEEQRLPQNAGALGTNGERHAIELLGWRRDAVDGREVRVRITIACREKVHEVAVVPYKVAHEEPGFFGHRHGGFARELRILAPVFAGCENAIEAQPLAYELTQRFASAGVIEQPSRGFVEAGECIQIATRGCGEQVPIGHAVPQSVGEARGGGIGLPLRF
ncbi:MAG: hypothetical protein FJW31_12870 [Acidobacteria bacterium]|nr:hypothetical protein [Acidobacteriota bacterium]